MKKNFNYFVMMSFCLFMAVGFISCEDDDEGGNGVTPTNRTLFILNEGSSKTNTSDISVVNLEDSILNSNKLGDFIGDTGQDLLIYGSKLYVSVSGSSYVKVIDAKTGGNIKNIEVKDDKGEGRSPRYLASYGGKIYASTFDGNVIRIDTTSLSITGTTAVGTNPEGIAIAKGKIYVANSDGLNYLNGYENGKTVSVIDIATFKETTKIPVGVNPFKVQADQYGDVYVNCKGNYTGTSFYRINTNTDEASVVAGVNVTNFTILDDYCYFYDVTYDAEWNATQTYGKFNVKTDKLESGSLITDGTKINTAYAIGVNPETKDVYISDTDYLNDGTVYVFDSAGKKIQSFEAGLNPSGFAFYIW